MNKNNRGGAMAMVLVLLIFASYIGLMILKLAYTNVSISKSYVGDRRMYRGTDYVTNLISIKLQKDVKEMQNKAKQVTENYLKNPATLKTLNENSDYKYLIDTGSMDSEAYNYEFNNKYNEEFQKEFKKSNYYKEKDEFTQATLDALITNGKAKVTDGGITYFKTSLVKGENIYYRLAKGSYDEANGLITLDIETKFEYDNDITRYGGSYNQDNKTNLQNVNKAQVVFKVSDNNESFSLQNYKLVNTKNDEIPIFQNQTALLAQKNIIFAQKSNDVDGNITITGDVIAFGYVPEDDRLKWNDYGGIFFGHTKKLSSSDVFGSNWANKMANDILLYNTYNTRYAGNVTINGNVATMGYVNIASNKDKEVNIRGDTFARQFILSEDSHGSKVYLGDKTDSKYTFTYNNTETEKDINELLKSGTLCVSDDLQVDSSNSKLEVRGDFYGLADTYSNVGGSSGSSDFEDEKRISTVNINGNSIVELRSKIYIGGTSVVNNVKNKTTGYSYTTGISGAKTSQALAEAYIINEKNPYVYTNSGVMTPSTEDYTYKGDTIQMINGYTGKLGDNFTLADRAIHFKKYFDNNIKDDFGLIATMNFSNLRVKTNAQGNIEGWAQGVVIASGVKNFSNIFGEGTSLNAYYDTGSNNGSKFSEVDSDTFHDQNSNPYSQYSMIQKYQAYMSAFIDSYNFGSTGRNIIQKSPDKTLDQYLSDSGSVMNVIKNEADTKSNGICLHKNSELDAILCYSKKENQNIVIKKGSSNNKISIDGVESNVSNKGIIFAKGDIYIEDGVEFTGIIVSCGNITIEGSVNIKRYGDYYIGSSRSDIVSELKDKDCYVKTFFGLNDYELDNNDNVKIQRVNQDYVKIVKWTLV